MRRKKHLRLKSGGTITLSGNFQLLSLSPKDRAFISDLISRLESYDQNSFKALRAHKPTSGSEEEESDEGT